MGILMTEYGKSYNQPRGISEADYYEMMYEFTNLAKDKGLTVRQAQRLFIDCADAVLSSTVDYVRK